MRHSWYKFKWIQCLTANIQLQKYLRNIVPKYLLLIPSSSWAGPRSRTSNAYWVSDISGVILQHQEVNRQPLSHWHTANISSWAFLLCYDLSLTENTGNLLELGFTKSVTFFSTDPDWLSNESETDRRIEVLLSFEI